MAQLPLIQAKDQSMNLQLTRWKSLVDPVLANPMTNPSILKNVSLVVGDNVVNHKLGRMQQGWMIVDVDAPATIYRSAALNSTTLTLNSDAACVVSIAVF
jgi:hypothetical protein